MRKPSARLLLALFPVLGALTACENGGPHDRARVSGQVEATSVEIAGEGGGRLLELTMNEGDHVRRNDVVARFDTRDIDLALQRARAEREHAVAQLKLLQAGARPEEIRQAAAQVESARAETNAADAELKAAQMDLERFEQLLRSNSGSQKQRDDAATRRDVAQPRVEAARERERAARENLARVRAGARSEEIEAARARVAIADAQIAAFQKNLDDATVRAPGDGMVTEKLAEPGEVVAPRTPLLVVSDLDHAWAEVFVDEPDVPRLRLGQVATVFTDAGGPGIPGKISFISSKAEFTPRNVQTAEERSKLVYRVKIAVDNRDGVLKEGMPVEAEIPFQTSGRSDTRND
jgi:HlyD family secretion protein